jgi:hypothetical protein|nr:MAG TPA: hypothetical protein [Caudoviricetes sp.]
MKTKDLKINFRYLGGNIACLSVDSIDGKSIHNDINNEEAIIIFNSLVGEKENCQTVKKLLQENQELKEKLDKYENPKDMTLFAMWCTEKVKDENEKLKKHLKVPKACNLKTLEDYKSYYEDTTREQILEDTYIEYCAYVNLAHRYSKLKKQLEEINNFIKKCGFVNIEQVALNYCGLLSQQKEFIKLLEGNMRFAPEPRKGLLKDILNKYKEIIGGNKDEK